MNSDLYITSPSLGTPGGKILYDFIDLENKERKERRLMERRETSESVGGMSNTRQSKLGVGVFHGTARSDRDPFEVFCDLTPTLNPLLGLRPKIPFST